MTMQEFLDGCPDGAHIYGFNFDGKDLEVVSAKGYDSIDGKPGNKAIVWDKLGKAYSRVRTEKTKNWKKGVYFQGFLYGRDEKFDIKVKVS